MGEGWGEGEKASGVFPFSCFRGQIVLEFLLLFELFEILNFGFVSDFELRISNLKRRA